LGREIDTVKESTEPLIGASQEVGLEVNFEKTKHVSLLGHQIARENHDIMIANTSFENVSLGMTEVNQNLIQKELRGDRIPVMLATIQSRSFCFLI
jgi:hypothetical protein